jgi:hypothetical protein
MPSLAKHADMPYSKTTLSNHSFLSLIYFITNTIVVGTKLPREPTNNFPKKKVSPKAAHSAEPLLT